VAPGTDFFGAPISKFKDKLPYTSPGQLFMFMNRVHQGGCRWGVAPPGKNFSKKSQRGDQGEIYPPPRRFFEKFKRKPQRGDQRKFFGLNSEMFLKNISFGSPFEISIEFRQKSLKNYDFV
jgi:hypothetical protein